jgi:cysteine desulfurase
MIYLDHNASTPVDPRAREAVRQAEDVFGNASSVHAAGQPARRLVEESRDAVSRLVGGAGGAIVFTSGATEANALALLGAAAGRRGRIVVSGAEHPSVRENAARRAARDGCELVRVDPDPSGALDPGRVLAAAAEDTVLVSVMAASNEYGALHPIGRIAEGLRGRGVLLHTDAAQAGGRIPIDAAAWGVDLLSLSAHKMNGPKGAGALWVRRGVALEPLAGGGGQEKGMRPGTENTAAIAGFGAAADVARRALAADGDGRAGGVRALRDRLEAGILRTVPGARALAASAPRLPNTSAVLFDGVSGEALMIALDLEGIAVSVGSACSSGTVSPSPALLALGLSRDESMRVVRFSLGPTNTEAEIAAVLDVLPRTVERVRAATHEARSRATEGARPRAAEVSA